MTMPCPHCGKPMGVRTQNELAPKVRRSLGPHRDAALAESQEGWCAICDELPIPAPRTKGTLHRRYTCGRPKCVEEWGRLASLDWHLKKGRAR